MTLSLEQANAILAAAFDAAARVGARPIGVIVLDAGGQPVAYQRQDGASLFRFDIARGKAMTALGMGVDSGVIAQRASGNPAFFTSVAAVTGALVLSAGGVLILDRGQVIGAVGISGDTPEVDAACAAAGIAAAGFNCMESRA